jgi:hypothetical protein
LAVVLAALAACSLALPAISFAQGLDLSQLLGGGSKHHGGGSKSNADGVTVQRAAKPFTGKFVGKQEEQGAETTMTAEFACYPASDSALPQVKAFVCYTGQTGQSKAKTTAGGDTP